MILGITVHDDINIDVDIDILENQDVNTYISKFSFFTNDTNINDSIQTVMPSLNEFNQI